MKAESRAATKVARAAVPASVEDVLSAVKSLYEDLLKPYGRILRKRLLERAADHIDHDLGQLRAICEACLQLQVLPEDGGEWCVLFVGSSTEFVDVYSPDDPYPEELWQAADAHFRHLGGKEAFLPGGRYACAHALQLQQLQFLRGRSLGEVCHIVQLAISQRKVLGYSNGAIAPYDSSHSMLKDRAASQSSSCAGRFGVGSGSSLQLATWDTARECLRQIMNDAAGVGISVDDHGIGGSVPLSNIKRLFRTKFHIELSETALGHSKLSNLLHDSRLGSVCTVRLCDHGYLVESRLDEPPNTSAVAGSRMPLDLCTHMMNCLVPSPASTACLTNNARKYFQEGCISSIVQNTFIHAQSPPAYPVEVQRSRSLPKDFGSSRAAWSHFSESTFPAGTQTIAEERRARARPGQGSVLDQYRKSQADLEVHQPLPVSDPIDIERMMLSPLCITADEHEEDEDAQGAKSTESTAIDMVFAAPTPSPGAEYEPHTLVFEHGCARLPHEVSACRWHPMLASPALTASPCWTPQSWICAPRAAPLADAIPQVLHLSDHIPWPPCS